ncbi:MAG: DedA family protein [Cyanobacteria bacterium P01_F01_bin.42]
MAFDLDWVSLEALESLAQQYGYGAVFVGIFLENLGLPLPGEAIVLVGGFAAGRGDLTLEGTVLSAASGAVMGNTVGYGLGYFGGWPLLLRVGQLLRLEEKRLVQIKEKFSHNAGQAVFFGRFVTLLRIFAGPMAGLVRMQFGLFMLCNLAGAVLWAATMVGLAYFAGEFVPLEQLLKWVGQFGIVVLGGIFAWMFTPSLLRNLNRLRKHPVEESEA